MLRSYVSGLPVAIGVLGLLATVPALATGRTPGSFAVSSDGEAQYSIPIFAPPGVNGLAPQLALTYGHRHEGTLAGVGWGVSGLSAIHRCEKTWAQNNEAKAPQNESDDRVGAYRSHAVLRSEGYAPPIVDQSARGFPDGYIAIRGREQQLIDQRGGVGEYLLRNRIRAVARCNPAGRNYHDAANVTFSEELAPYTGGVFFGLKCTAAP